MCLCDIFDRFCPYTTPISTATLSSAPQPTKYQKILINSNHHLQVAVVVAVTGAHTREIWSRLQLEIAVAVENRCRGWGSLRWQYTMLHDARDTAPHHHFGSKWWRTGEIRRAPTDQICLDFLGGLKHGYSVATQIIESYRWCIAACTYTLSKNCLFFPRQNDWRGWRAWRYKEPILLRVTVFYCH